MNLSGSGEGLYINFGNLQQSHNIGRPRYDKLWRMNVLRLVISWFSD
jgi:hypothetical protein